MPRQRPLRAYGANICNSVPILFLDDNAAIRRVLCELFQGQADFEVCGEAENGQDAIEKAQEFHPDLIVLDLSMPVMNGLEPAKGGQEGRADLGFEALRNPAVGRQTRGAQDRDRARARPED